MNKFAKGSLAAGAGLVLLLGGAGTLAYWNDSAELAGGTISTGTLTLEEQAAAGSWAPEIGTLVPGDTTTYSTTLVLDAEGDHIQGEVVFDPASIVYSGGAADVAPEELVEKFDLEVEFLEPTITEGLGELNPGSATVDPLFDSVTFEGAGTYEIPVEVTVTMPFGETVDNEAKNAQLDLSEVSFTATQTQADATAATSAN